MTGEDSPSRIVNVVRWVRSGSIAAGRVSTPSSRLLDPGLAVVLFSLGLPTTLAFNPHSPQNDEHARLGTVGGCARACTNALLHGRSCQEMCGEGEDVSSVHTLFSGVVQVCHELLVGEEEEKEEEQGRQEEREVEREDQVEETTRMDDYVDGCESARLKLEPNVSMDEMRKRG